MWRKSRQLANPRVCPSEVESERDKGDGGRYYAVLREVENRFEKLCGFKLGDLSSFESFAALLYRPSDPASLGVVRALFGLCMVLDVVEERGLGDVDIKWGDPMECHFPLIHGMKPLSLPWMISIYTIMWIGAFGIMLGSRFKIACACFLIPYWYIFLLDKSYWNNHTYLYGIVVILFWGTGADKYFALDASETKRSDNTVPLWNYFILKFQFFALYFLAGLKKSGVEWLSGYAMANLSRHWVFSPFRLFLTTEQTDFFIVHWFGFIFDLTVGFWMLFDKTRIPAMVFCTAFHLMNSRLFSIGMFPYVCLATMPLFCKPNWPRRLGIFLKRKSYFSFSAKIQDIKICNKATIDLPKESHDNLSGNGSSIDNGNREGTNSINSTITCKNTKRIDRGKSAKVTRKQKFVVSLLLFHVFLQFFLPYSHFITKGYNNWVPGMYGYSWDMMVHVWDTVLVVVKVHDNASNEDRYLDPTAWVQSNRWEKHGDMLVQYASCLKENLIKQENQFFENNFQRDKRPKWSRLSSNLSIYIDVWCSLNGRFQQRMFNPNVDMLTVDWHPFKPISFLMPLLSQYNSYRYKLEEIQQQIYTWSNDTDVLFVADFPGMHLDNYITKNFTNVTLTVLEGEVTYSDEKRKHDIMVAKGSSIPIETGQFHKVKTISAYPACYMYTCTNLNKQQSETNGTTELEESKEGLSIAKEINYKIDAWIRAFHHIANAFFYLVYDVPMVRRVQISN
ncbi:vitamin K-dependent gamma-carboxylase [Apis dorsata]|uniref:vitamin K-dependent gamma-carboxylase n=1 Tax=Apis dorsata TaxID=7462 RepID=UPI0003DF6342|nr:vitamin K-dependent gamma-carboxylase [Apis dorsata]XP_006616445.1 vitamin K-dependent gamma-carboxylase [Apis dorsata]